MEVLQDACQCKIQRPEPQDCEYIRSVNYERIIGDGQDRRDGNLLPGKYPKGANDPIQIMAPSIL